MAASPAELVGVVLWIVGVATVSVAAVVVAVGVVIGEVLLRTVGVTVEAMGVAVGVAAVGVIMGEAVGVAMMGVAVVVTIGVEAVGVVFLRMVGSGGASAGALGSRDPGGCCAWLATPSLIMLSFSSAARSLSSSRSVAVKYLSPSRRLLPLAAGTEGTATGTPGTAWVRRSSTRGRLSPCGQRSSVEAEVVAV